MFEAAEDRAASGELAAVRNLALLELLYGSGLRATELVSLPRGAMRPGQPFLMVRGKGSKERLVPISSRAEAAVAKWLEIAPGGTDSLPIHAYGNCEATQCDWGTQTATFDGEQAKGTWQVARESDSVPARTALITIKPVAGGMRVTIDNTFSDNRSPNHAQFMFVRAQ